VPFLLLAAVAADSDDEAILGEARESVDPGASED
jgi:hypothetical protein